MNLFRAANFCPPDSPRASRSALLALSALALIMLAAAPPRTAAQEATAETPEEVVSVRTDLVTVPVFVTDGRGRRVAGLGRGDFEVLEDGRPVEAAYFAAGAERVALLFLLDASGSTRDIVTRQRETALALFSRFGERSRVAVMPFGERPGLSPQFTTQAAEARGALIFRATRNQRTAIFDAALAAVRAFAVGGAPGAERRLVVLISDGLDTASATRWGQVVREARERDVSFYVIHLPLYVPRAGRLAPRRPSKGFRELAEQTGGRHFVVGDAASALDPRADVDLRPVFGAVADDLEGQYVLGYYAGDGRRARGAHRIQVRLTSPDRRRLRVRPLREEYTPKE